jgi:hypothetical protein
MVQTRSQKRKIVDTEELGEQEFVPEQENIHIKIKKRKISNSQLNFKAKELEKELDSDQVYSESEMSTNSTSQENEMDIEENEESDIEIEESNDEEDDDPNLPLEEKIKKLKFNQTQINEIMMDSIKNIFKRYAREGKEFIHNLDGKQDPNEQIYEDFHELVESVYDGEFFERVPLEDRKKYIKEQLTPEQIKELKEQLEQIHDTYRNSSPSIIDILKMNISLEQKQKLLERVHCLVNSEVLTPEYNSNMKFLHANISNNDDPELLALEERILKSSLNKTDSYRMKILKSKMSFENKVIAYKKLEIMETYEDTDTSEYAKYKSWMDSLLSIPFGMYNDSGVTTNSELNDISNYIKNVRNVLDEKLSFLEKPKDQIINLVTQMVRNPDVNINAIGLQGPPGVGKTMICESIAKALNRPFKMISLGGESDASSLNGHGFTYVGSMPGSIISTLSETKSMNPIVLIDECFPYYQKVITEDGSIEIGKLYYNFQNNKHVPKIKSFNNITQEFEYKNITNVWEKYNENLLELNIGGYTTKCTENHLFLTENGYITAKNLTTKDNILSQPSRFSSKKLNDDQYQIVLGSFLGDGHIYKLKSNKIGLSVRHGIEQKEYCEWKAKMFDVDTKTIEKNGYSQNQAIMFDTKIIHITKEFPLSKTSCPQWLIDDLDWRGIAIWIMDDGSITKKGGYGTFKISTDSFDIDSQIRLVKKLNDLGIECSFIKYKKTYYRIDLTANGCKNLIVNIFPYIHSSMVYKILTKDLQNRFELKNDTYWSFSEITNPIINKIYNVWSCTSQKIINYEYKYCNKCKTNMFFLQTGCCHKEIRNDNLYLIKNLKPYIWNFNNYKYNLINLQSKQKVKNISKYKKYNNKVYDIEIEDNHNFLITSDTTKYIKNNIGIIVHNCDKVSETHHGKEIIGTLIHLTDSTSNNKYNHDKYFSGIEFDLSKVLFVFTYNDASKIDRILADRLIKINVDNYNFKEKLEITNKHIIPYLLDKFKFNQNDITFNQDALEYIVRDSKKETGMRDIKTKIKIIISRINNLLLTNETDNIIKLKYKKLYPNYKSLPVIVPKEHIETLLDESISDSDKNDRPPPGMYI